MKKAAAILAIFMIGSLFIYPVFAQDTQSNPILNIEPEVNFISAAPVIDGVLDDSLQNLPARMFRFTYRSNPKNSLAEVSYRLAYGSDFFYLFIEAQTDSFVCRDRGYQNGDGFHLVFAIPDSGRVKTDEFYVLAFSPQMNPKRSWQKKFIWYRNRDLSFKKLKNTRFKVKSEDGKTGYELLIPWSEIYPYHPWHLNKSGFNLSFVQAVGEKEKNYFFIVEDWRMQSEQSSRLYGGLKFSSPVPAKILQAYGILNKNHCSRGEDIALKIAGISGESKTLKIIYKILDDKEKIVKNGEFIPEYSEKLSRKNYFLKTSDLLSGSYRLQLSDNSGNFTQEIPFTILPNIKPAGLKKRLTNIKNKIDPGSYTTLEFKLEEIKTKMRKLKYYDTAGELQKNIKKFLLILEQAETGKDIIASRTGLSRRAYKSKVDGTLQPYTVKIPRNMQTGKKYPLLVFLHGSGMDDRRVLKESSEEPLNNFIELAPFGRGTSNAYSADHAQDDIREAIDDVIKHYPVDTSRIILSGFSMGGYGVYRTFYESPDRFRALAIFSGHPDLANKYGVPGTHPNFLQPEYLKPFKDVPIFIFHGKQDRNCPFELTEQLIAALRKAGAKVTFYFEENKGHGRPEKETFKKYLQWLLRVTK